MLTLKAPRAAIFVGKTKVPLLVTVIVSAPLFCSARLAPALSPESVPLTAPSAVLLPPQAVRTILIKARDMSEVVFEIFMVCVKVDELGFW